MIKRFLKFHPVHKKLVPNFDLIFLLRPTLFFSVWVMVVIGMAAARMQLVDYPLWITEFSWRTFLSFIGLTCVCGSAFILNQINDVKSDTINQKLFLVGNHISSEKSQAIARVLLIIGIIVSVAADWFIGILIGCIYLVWGILYNQEPYNWKKNPILGWLGNTVVGFILFSIGWALIMKYQPDAGVVPLKPVLIIKMLPYLLSFSAVSLLTTLPDMIGDTQVGDRTFPIVFGKTATILISLTLIFIAFIISLHIKDPIASTATLVSLPFFVFTAFRRLEKDVLRAIRYPIFILNFFALSVYPWLVVPLLITYYLSKYYYWHRFNIHYPTFLVDHD